MAINKIKDFRMPAEWSQHTATQLNWPSNRETWPGDRLDRVIEVYLDIIETLHTYEPIVLLADVSVKIEEVKEILSSRNIDLSAVHIYRKAINDVWARDCGPIFIKNSSGDAMITDWDYNAWGSKYPPFDSDNAIPEWFSDTFGIKRISMNMVLEGGSIETNGDGILLTTESVLLNKNRNPDMTKSEIEKKLQTYLGIDKVIWLKGGLAGDDTDGHIDDLSRFLNQNTILTVVSQDPNDINYKTLQENLRLLQSATNKEGKPFHIVELPLPKTRIEGTTVDGSEYVPASYANFYIANGVVLVPMYDPEYDEIALDLFKEYFTDRDIIGINCSDLVWGQGSIHCITQQLYGIEF